MNRTLLKRLAGLLAILAGVLVYAWINYDPESDAVEIRTSLMTAISLAVLYMSYAFVNLAWRAVSEERPVDDAASVVERPDDTRRR